MPALKPRAKGARPHAAPLPSASTVNVLSPPAGAVPDHGTSELVDFASPHFSGVARTECGPSLNLSLKSVNGSCGPSSKVVVSWPVADRA